MNIMETANALGLAQSFDNRTVGEANVRAWHRLLADLDPALVTEAIERHYSSETAWIMPAHIIRLVGEIEAERARDARKWAAGQYGVPVADALPELPRGERLTEADVSPRVLELLSQLRATLPESPRSRLFPREAYWEQQQRAFQEQPTPNPLYRPEAAQEAQDIIRAADIADCRTAGPHDSGVHIETCPDAVQAD